MWPASQPTASEHLALLLSGGLVTREKSGRHMYYRLASPEIAQALEQLAVHTAQIAPKDVTSYRKQTPIQNARLCYDHIAGRLGVAIADALVAKGILIVLDSDYALTQLGVDLFVSLGMDVTALRKSKRVFARQCLDWSERRHHVSGAIGAALADLAFDQGWITRAKERRVLHVTPKGLREMNRHFGLKFGGDTSPIGLHGHAQ
ncbi:ArsR/SmtB family transcription factor [Halocynthiibacter namhaensis]|uniref:ArsR/SmtB family transcription factor n=1 Tax=Halocynthiibacter namhaensis TaxID=1290553 RepID=UPI00068D9FAB|nr:helix-turn-helix domain-containing protein [Halocynthiibacter namhaensis]